MPLSKIKTNSLANTANVVVANNTITLGQIPGSGAIGVSATEMPVPFTPIRALHVRGNVAGEVVISADYGSANNKYWNLLVNTPNSNTNVKSEFQIRQLNDAGTGGNIPFAINGSGYVSKQYQPGFLAYSSSPGSTITGNFRAWNSWTTNLTGVNYPGTAGFNESSSFNTTTGIFTAPITGRYLIGMIAHGSGPGGARRIAHLLFSNGSYTEFIENWSEYGDSGASVVMHMVAGDWLRYGDHATIPMESLHAFAYFLG